MEFLKKVDGPVELIPYEKRMPLEIELEYFFNHLMEKKTKNIKYP